MKLRAINIHETPPLQQGAVSGSLQCNGELGKIIGIYLFNEKDAVYDKDGNFIRMKRKYGKYKREVYYEKRGQ